MIFSGIFSSHIEKSIQILRLHKFLSRFFFARKRRKEKANKKKRRKGIFAPCEGRGSSKQASLFRALHCAAF
jgi:hypothetical protein